MFGGICLGKSKLRRIVENDPHPYADSYEVGEIVVDCPGCGEIWGANKNDPEMGDFLRKEKEEGSK